MGVLRRTWYRILGVGQTFERPSLNRLGDFWMVQDVTRDYVFHPILNAEFSRARTRATTCFLMRARLRKLEQLHFGPLWPEMNHCYRDFEVLMHCMGAPSTAPADLVKGAFLSDLRFLRKVATLGLRVEPAAFGMWYLVRNENGERVVVPGDPARSVDAWTRFLNSPEGAELKVTAPREA